MAISRKPENTRLCWCAETACRWREPGVACPSRPGPYQSRNPVQLFTIHGLSAKARAMLDMGKV